MLFKVYVDTERFFHFLIAGESPEQELDAGSIKAALELRYQGNFIQRGRPYKGNL